MPDSVGHRTDHVDPWNEGLSPRAVSHVRGAIRDALALGVIGFDAVKHLVLCRIEHRPPRLDLAQSPHLPAARVTTTAAADDLTLLGVGAE